MTRRRILALALVLAAVPAVLSARPRYGGGRYGDPPPSRGGHDLGRVIADCERRTDDFRKSLHYANDRSFRNHMRMEDLTRHADRLERSMNVVRESWNRHRDPRQTRRFVSDALATGQDIHRQISRGRIHPEIERQWSAIRSELNRMAEAFDLPRIRW